MDQENVISTLAYDELFWQVSSAPLPDLSEEDYAVWVYTGGSSPLLPAMHAILGLRKLDGISGPLQEHWQMQGGPLCASGFSESEKTAEVSNRVKMFVHGTVNYVVPAVLT